MKSHIIELDILLEMDQNCWIVDKSKPNMPIMKLTIHDFNLFKNGIYKKQNNKLEFNGQVYWISSNFLNKLKLQCKKTKSDISNLAISMQEFLNKEIIEKIDFKIKKDIIKNIKSNEDIYILCSKNNKERLDKPIEKIKEIIKESGLSIKDIYFISETFYNKNDDEISNIKSKIILQHLIGFHINGNIISNGLIGDEYNEIVYYDNNLKSIENSKQINKLLEELLLKSDREIKLKIKDKIRSHTKILISKYYTGNNQNKYLSFETELEYTNVIKNFENFNPSSF